MLDRQLMQGATGDSAAKHLHRSKNAHMGQFLSGAAKKNLVVQRKADEAVPDNSSTMLTNFNKLFIIIINILDYIYTH